MLHLYGVQIAELIKIVGKRPAGDLKNPAGLLTISIHQPKQPQRNLVVRSINIQKTVTLYIKQTYTVKLSNIILLYALQQYFVDHW